MAEIIEAQIRESSGSSEARRLRRSGRVPVVLYGHGEPVVSLSVSSSQLAAAVRHGARMVELSGAAKTKAFIKELQWDTFHTAIQHVDFFRVSAGEKVEVTLGVHLRGEAVGLRSGGSVEVLRHELKVRCPAEKIPEAIEVDVTNLDIDDVIRVENLPAIEGVEYLDEMHDVVVQCAASRVEEELVEEPGDGSEPEVISRGKDESEDESED